jgi:hypothetical protein
MAVQSGIPFPQQPAVDLVDVNGERVFGATGTVTAALASGVGTLSGTLTAAAAAGRATFVGLAVTVPPGSPDPSPHQIRFTSPGLPDVLSNVFDVVPAVTLVPTRLAFGSTPVAVNENAVMSSVQVRVETADGTLAPSYVGTITLSIFSVVYISGTERDVVLRATAPGLTTAFSTSIRVTLV